jgi:hypothetical protein
MDDERELKRAFSALRDRDRDRAPAFGPMRARAERRASRVRRGAIAAGVIAIAASILLAIWSAQPTGEREVAIAAPRESLGFLLAPPSASVTSGAAPIEQIGEAW